MRLNLSGIAYMYDERVSLEFGWAGNGSTNTVTFARVDRSVYAYKARYAIDDDGAAPRR